MLSSFLIAFGVVVAYTLLFALMTLAARRRVQIRQSPRPRLLALWIAVRVVIVFVGAFGGAYLSRTSYTGLARFIAAWAGSGAAFAFWFFIVALGRGIRGVGRARP
ncbi:MAG: hypothetical protein ACXVES_07520 [Actinomycetota bacterium]